MTAAKPKEPRRPPVRKSPLPALALTLAILMAVAAGALFALDAGLWTLPVAAAGTEPEPAAPAAAQTAPDSLREREAAVNRAQAELQEREAHLREQEKQISDLLRELVVQRAEADSVRRVAQIYAHMPPAAAARALLEMETSLAVQILRILTEDEVAAILTYMEPASSARLTTLLTNGAARPGGGE